MNTKSLHGKSFHYYSEEKRGIEFHSMTMGFLQIRSILNVTTQIVIAKTLPRFFSKLNPFPMLPHRYRTNQKLPHR